MALQGLCEFKKGEYRDPCMDLARGAALASSPLGQGPGGRADGESAGRLPSPGCGTRGDVRGCRPHAGPLWTVCARRGAPPGATYLWLQPGGEHGNPVTLPDDAPPRACRRPSAWRGGSGSGVGPRDTGIRAFGRFYRKGEKSGALRGCVRAVLDHARGFAWGLWRHEWWGGEGYGDLNGGGGLPEAAAGICQRRFRLSLFRRD